ncbi:hypothetical protein ACFE04_032011 [Oxalis oulophora]
MADKLTEDEIADFREAFCMIDKDADGFVKMEELANDSATATDEISEAFKVHDSNPLSMNSAKIGILKESNKVSLCSLLESGDGTALKPQISLEILSDLSDKPLERKLPNQQLSALLVLPYLSQCNCPWPESMWLLHSSYCWC